MGSCASLDRSRSADDLFLTRVLLILPRLVISLGALISVVHVR